jgi:hypothetical protein
MELIRLLTFDQEDHGSGKPVQAPYLEKTHYKKGLVEWLKV